MRDLVGSQNENLRHIELSLNITVHCRGNQLILTGNEKNVTIAQDVLNALWNKLEQNQDVGVQDIDAALRFSSKIIHDNKDECKSNDKQTTPYLDDKNIIKTRKKIVNARSPAQAKYIEQMRNKDMVFACGPGGTGKTYLGVAFAVMLFLEGKIDRMIFTRPAVEAGENLGFLPGDIKEKVDPYLRPIYDALFDVMHGDKVAAKIANGDIEIAPLAFMRGRTLKNAFVLLDEAQNTTSMQMKMFLTRMGEGTKMIITGDPSQIDLPDKTPSGLVEAQKILKGSQNISFINFTSKDVVRHKLVSEVIDAYSQYDQSKSR